MQCFFLSRHKINTNLYIKKNENDELKQVSIKQLTQKMRVNEIRNRKVYLGSKKQLEVRLVIQKLPKKIADQRKRKLRKNSKNTPSAERLAACEYTLLITNITEEVLSGQDILTTYGVRWQIEILFKGWKSVMKFGEVHPMKTDRFLCMLYGHLLWIVLTMKIISWSRTIFWEKYKIELSELKAFKIINAYHHKLLETLYKNDSDIVQVVEKILNALFLLAEKEGKKHNGKKRTINLFSVS